jgi:general secretion pathway protein G
MLQDCTRPEKFRRSSLLFNQEGWTLVELMIVISIITVLSTIALVGYGSAVTRSREAVLKENLFRIRETIDQYHTDKGQYPSNLAALVSAEYLRRVPEDPFTRLADTWQMVLADIDPGDPSFQGIYDIKSGSEALALDGTAYADW